MRPDRFGVLRIDELAETRWSRPSDEQRNQRRHALRVHRVSLAELPAHDGLLNSELAPERRARDDDGEHAAPLPDRQPGSGEADEDAGVNRVADEA